MARTRAQQNRKIRQDALREQLAAQGHVQHIIENIKEIEELDVYEATFTNTLTKLKTANEQRFKLVGKYLPDLKQTELVGDGGEPIDQKWTVEVVDAKPTNT